MESGGIATTIQFLFLFWEGSYWIDQMFTSGSQCNYVYRYDMFQITSTDDESDIKKLWENI